MTGKRLWPHVAPKPSSPSITYRYDDRGNLVQVTEVLGPASSSRFYSGEMVQPVAPDGDGLDLRVQQLMAFTTRGKK